MLLCDIGNSRAKFYDKGKVWSVGIEEIEKYKEFKVCYICVNDRVYPKLKEWKSWRDLEPFITLKGGYEGLGVDRKLLASRYTEGIFIDAGSAITVDVVKEGIYQGGFIYPGLKALKQSYKNISPRLEVDNFSFSSSLPKSTLEGVGFGAIAPLVCLIEKLYTSLKLPTFITGGDGEKLARYIPFATYNPLLLFEAMLKLIKRKGLC